MTRASDNARGPAPPIREFLIQVRGGDREALLRYAVERGHGVDVTDLISGGLLDDGLRCRELASWYRHRLSDVGGMLSFHGAARDLQRPGLADRVGDLGEKVRRAIWPALMSACAIVR